MNKMIVLGAIALLSSAAFAAEPRLATLGKEDKPTVAVWLDTSLKRIFPNTNPGDAKLQLLAPRNARIAFQACLRSNRVYRLSSDCEVAPGAEDLKPQVRLVGFVPMPHLTPNTELAELDGVDSLPGLVPDPLYPKTKTFIGQNESRSYWITLNIPADAKPDVRELKVRMLLGDNREPTELAVTLEIADLVVQPRKGFPVIHWWRGEATWDFYKTGMFEDPRWWDITREQLKNMLAHGSDVVYVPIFFDRRETFKRPCQLLVVDEPEKGKYTFDWTLTKKFVDMCKELGFTKFEWSHLWIYWGVENPERIYTRKGDKYEMLWPPDISGFSNTFMNFLRQFLPEFKSFLDREGLTESSYFHLSDEPGSGKHVENYKRARQILRDLAPWMKVMDALSDIQYGRQGLTDIPIPLVDSAQSYIDKKIPHWVYYCCAPQGKWLNRFMDTPLPKVRMAGWLFYKHRAQGFLHWGFNYWHRMESETIGDPFTQGDNKAWPDIPFGDPFMIYPGDDGKPIDSIRWEVFAESLQDYAILQSAGIDPDDAMLSELKTYADFPKSEQWLQTTLQKVLKGEK